jgi:hypothetical protein
VAPFISAFIFHKCANIKEIDMKYFFYKMAKIWLLAAAEAIANNNKFSLMGTKRKKKNTIKWLAHYTLHHDRLTKLEKENLK